VGRLCLLERRQPQLLSLSQQSCAIPRVAQGQRDRSSSLKPQGTAREIRRQASASLQCCHGHCVGTTKLRALGRLFKPHRHLFVRAGSGTGGVPSGTIRIIGESFGEGSMRSPPLLSGRRLLHCRTNQRMPEDEAFGTERTESRRSGRRPAIDAKCCSAKPLGGCRESIQLRLIECRNEKSSSSDSRGVTWGNSHMAGISESVEAR